MRYLATVELIDGTFIHLISEFSQQFVPSEKASEVLISVLQQIYALGNFFKSVQFGHLYRKLHNRNLRNSMRKDRI